jgi:hypothetical protein
MYRPIRPFTYNPTNGVRGSGDNNPPRPNMMQHTSHPQAAAYNNKNPRGPRLGGYSSSSMPRAPYGGGQQQGQAPRQRSPGPPKIFDLIDKVHIPPPKAVETNPNCICERKVDYVLCNGCGYMDESGKVRVRRPCPIHPKVCSRHYISFKTVNIMNDK